MQLSWKPSGGPVSLGEWEQHTKVSCLRLSSLKKKRKEKEKHVINFCFELNFCAFLMLLLNDVYFLLCCILLLVSICLGYWIKAYGQNGIYIWVGVNLGKSRPLQPSFT